MDWTNQFLMNMDFEKDDNESKMPRVDSSLYTPVVATAKFCEMTPNQIAITVIQKMRSVPPWLDLTTVDSSLCPESAAKSMFHTPLTNPTHPVILGNEQAAAASQASWSSFTQNQQFLHTASNAEENRLRALNGPQKQPKTDAEKIKARNEASRKCRTKKKIDFVLMKIRLNELQLDYQRMQQEAEKFRKVAKRQYQENCQLRQQLTTLKIQ